MVRNDVAVKQRCAAVRHGVHALPAIPIFESGPLLAAPFSSRALVRRKSSAQP